MNFNLFGTINQLFLRQLLIGFGILIASYIALHLILKAVGRDSRFLIPPHFATRIKLPLFLLLAAVTTKLLPVEEYVTEELTATTNGIATILLIIAITWIIIAVLKVIKQRIVASYDINASNNLRARKIYTQFNILERIAIFIIIVFAIGIGLMSFESIRSIGVSMLTSAGVAGIIIGFSAQKALGTLLAGIQIAFTQPIRLDDVVIVEGEWGTIEEITLTYVVIKIWDKRRLIVPTTYFIEKPFQNWTRETSEILGTVFIFTDYKMNVEALRTELTRVLHATELWDKQVNVLQVTDVKPEGIEIRALMSAKDSPTAWDLRVHVREQLVRFIQENYPESIPRSRILLKKSEATT
ncbi:mechanosensitive ion channel family protein [Aquimarina sp. ERC-38]|uniref:mechanosensitive ion channel family protein n=1 Tax=Aquimarina sp. ERC-38 TaxID=2949996 RepID=UPI00224505C4|nr:mechanosensitive ion channel domain-containing protein [Aquimarina sp. ERC-38]UZO79996.1 mechanosensitive ion channel family protein [Aquimarina sp. ERC-38]